MIQTGGFVYTLDDQQRMVVLQHQRDDLPKVLDQLRKTLALAVGTGQAGDMPDVQARDRATFNDGPSASVRS